MTVKAISHKTILPLPRAYRKQLHNEKVVKIFLSVMTGGVYYGILKGIHFTKVTLLNHFFLPSLYRDPSEISPIVDKDAQRPDICNANGVKLDVTEIMNPSSKKWLVYF